MRRPPAAARPTPLLPRWPLISVIAVVVAGGAGFATRGYVGRRAARELIVPAPAGAVTSPLAGIPYADLMLPSGDHTIHARWVRAPAASDSGRAGARTAPAAPAAPAVLIFHGNRTNLARQAGVQQVLYRAGISSLAFDYAGFGTSAGTPSRGALREDARVAFVTFADSARSASRRVLLGTSLGAAVLLDAAADLQTGIDGVVLVGAFTSARDVAVRAGKVPRWLTWLMPDLYDNVAAVQRIIRPLLIVHSVADTVFPMAGAERLLAAAPDPKRLVRLERTGHDEYLSSDADWQPVIAFIRKGFE